jgi:hypothetical protein
MKRGLKIFGIVFGVIVAILLIIPLFVNVDKFRPEIEKKVGQAINSKVKLGTLSLGLVPSIRIKTTALEVTPKDPNYPEKIVNCSDLKVSVPWTAIFGTVTATVEMSKPEIQIVERNGKYNFEVLTSADQAKEASPPAEKKEGPSFVEKKIDSARLTLQVKEAKVSLKSQKANANIVVDELSLKNLGLNSPIDIKVISTVNYADESIEVKGPFEFTGDVETTKKGNDLSAAFDVVGDFSKMLIKAGASFNKAEKVPFKFHMVGQFNKSATTDLNISDLNFELASLKLAGKAAAAGIQGDAGTMDVDIVNKTSSLEDIASLSPLLNDYKLQGSFSFFAKAKGTTKNPTLDIELKADNIKGKTPKLGLPINQLNVKLKVHGTLEDPVVELDPADMLIGKSDLRLRMKGHGLKAPDLVVSLQSKSLDLAFLNSGKESAAGAKSGESNGSGKALDAALDEMAPSVEKSLKNPMLDKAKLALTVNFGELKLQGAKLDNLNVQANYSGRSFSVKDASFAGYHGKVKMSGSSKLIPSAPTYDYNLKIDDVNLADAIAAHAPEWKGQLSGVLRGTSRIAGAGLRKSQLDKSLQGSIAGEIVHGHTSLQLSKILSVVMKQLPQRPDLKSAASEDKLKGKFKTLKLNTAIAGRKIIFKTLDILFEPDEYNFGEIQYKAEGSLTFEKYLDLVGNVFLDPKVVKWPEAVGKSGKIEIPIKLAGPMDAAKPDIGYSISKMGTRVLKKTVEKEAQKGIQKILEGQKPADILKNIFK